MKLGALFQEIPVLEKFNWDAAKPCGKITSDSRAIEPGDIFVAIPGSRMDGHDFLSQAIMAKASAVVFEKTPDFVFPPRVTGLRVESCLRCLRHGHPSFQNCVTGKLSGRPRQNSLAGSPK